MTNGQGYNLSNIHQEHLDEHTVAFSTQRKYINEMIRGNDINLPKFVQPACNDSLLDVYM